MCDVAEVVKIRNNASQADVIRLSSRCNKTLSVSRYIYTGSTIQASTIIVGNSEGLSPEYGGGAYETPYNSTNQDAECLNK